MEVFGIRLVGVNAHNGVRLLITILFIFTIVAIGRALNGLILRFLSGRRYFTIRFWILQSITLLLTVTTILGLLSIWFEDPARLATALGLITAGLVFALQRVITAFAGYLVILRGETFNIGDRITMGGVRGDVIGLGFIQTTIMEMGQPPEISDNNTSVWVRSRQYTGRIVTITNDKVFTEPVFNYSREFPYIWDELRVPTPTRLITQLPSRLCSMRHANKRRNSMSLVRQISKNSAGAILFEKTMSFRAYIGD